ncbi:MAG: ornithine--oxo-acid transaminase, partial [Candidatus Kariarchaeaceae archaeon]
SQEYIEREKEWTSPNYTPIPAVLAKGEGIWVWDVDGKKYLDCLSSYSAVNQGHRHPKIIQAAKDQMDRITLTSRAFFNDQLGSFMQKLCEYSGMEMACPMNTGAEAVETGLKTARRWGYYHKKVEENKAEIIVAAENFHGRTITIVGFSTDPDTHGGFGPATPGFKIIPFGDAQALKEAITPNTVAFMVEPIQGEAGVIVPPEGYLKEIRQICTDNNVLLILDEIQTGFARTGKRFAFEHENVKPDILLVGKALGGGLFPVSAALGSKEIMNVLSSGSHGSTFGGNPLGCAIGAAAIDVLLEENLAEKSAELGEYFKEKLETLPKDVVMDVRGKGLLLAIQFNDRGGAAKKYVLAMKERGLLAKQTHVHTIRFAPPLVITKEEIDYAFGIIQEAIEEVRATL